MVSEAAFYIFQKELNNTFFPQWVIFKAKWKKSVFIRFLRPNGMCEHGDTGVCLCVVSPWEQASASLSTGTVGDL